MNDQYFFKHYFENASINSIIVMDENGIIVRVNNVLQRIFNILPVI